VNGRYEHVLVTGGSSGIGKATACLFASAGAAVTIIARRAPELEAAAARIAAARPDGDRTRVLALRADVTDSAALRAAIGVACERFGVPDVLVCSAGIARPGHFATLGEEHFRVAMEVNYFGTLVAVRSVLGDMITAGRGHLVLISSGAALTGLFGYAAYGPSKFAVRALAETLRAELAATPVRVSVVYPPDVDTPQLAEENRTKPAELAMLSAPRPWSAEKAARVIVAGIARGAFVITGSWELRLLVYGHSVLGPVLRRYFDRVARKARRRLD
jgi:3-dehydrosphinganine reductase